MANDFPNAQPPQMLPLARSGATNAVEAELKALFIELFKTTLAQRTFDVSTLGAAHLGSLDLVKKAITADGLVLVQGDRQEAATRYLYRAWKSGDVQGRGLHFLRTYLQLLFPNACQVDQLWHDKTLPYPTGLCSAQPRLSWALHYLGQPGLKLDGSWRVGQHVATTDEIHPARAIPTDTMYLTSRVEIMLDFSVTTRSMSSLMHIIRSVIPARLVPVFRFWMSFALHVGTLMSMRKTVQKSARMRYPWPGRVITHTDDARWQLGSDGSPVKLPQPFGSFRVGEVRGGVSRWHLKSERIQSSVLMRSSASVKAYRLPRLGEPDRRLDASWALGKRALHVSGHASLTKSLDIAVTPATVELTLAVIKVH